MTSVFPAPLRRCLIAKTYDEACRIRLQVEGKKMSRQAFGVLPKIREVDHVLATNRTAAARVVEVHPEVSFALMSGGAAMRYGKKKAPGQSERRELLESLWPRSVEDMRASLRGSDYALDDLHDAMAALWSVRRWIAGKARVLGEAEVRDARGLPMRIVG